MQKEWIALSTLGSMYFDSAAILIIPRNMPRPVSIFASIILLGDSVDTDSKYSMSCFDNSSIVSP